MYALRHREPDRKRLTTIFIFKALNKLPKGKPLPDDGTKKGYRPLPRRPGEERKWSGKMGKGYVPEVEIVKRVRRERRLSWGEGEEEEVEGEKEKGKEKEEEKNKEDEMVTKYGFERIVRTETEATAMENEMVTKYGFERTAPEETVPTGMEDEMGIETPNTGDAQKVGQKGRYETQHQAQFFSMLPKEVRLLIYEKVLGGRVLHIVRRTKQLGHVPCKRGDLEKEESCRALGCRGSKEYNGYYASNGEGHGDLIQMLQVCRRLYTEAIPILYSTNTFDFDSMETVLSFSNLIPSHRFDTIQAISLNFQFRTSNQYNESSSNNTPRWERTWMVIGSMKSLQELSAVIVWPRIMPSWQHELRLLEPLRMVTGLKMFDVQLVELTQEAKGFDPKVKYKHLGKVVGGDDVESEEQLPFRIIRRREEDLE
ncbi:ankyrin repeat protein [Rutstroemia sp. NJR-2017a WRK4]|nr:ankyrin repeat protein [Rutstroemia sp. NJR-2017a WRK4]